MGFTCLKAVDSLRGDSLCFTTKVSGDSGIHLTDLWGMKGWVVLGAIQWFWTWEPWIGNPTPMLLLQVKTNYLLSEKEYCTLFQIINYIYWSFKYNWQISCNDLFRLSQGFWQGGLRFNFLWDLIFLRRLGYIYKFIHLTQVVFSNIQSKIKINGFLSGFLSTLNVVMDYCDWGACTFYWCRYED